MSRAGTVTSYIEKLLYQSGLIETSVHLPRSMFNIQNGIHIRLFSAMVISFYVFMNESMSEQVLYKVLLYNER